MAGARRLSMGDLNEDQVKALASIRDFLSQADRRQMVLYGAAGTGKTSLINVLLDELDKDPDSPVYYCTAPTNKAVDVIAERTGRDFDRTIYSLLGLTLLDFTDGRPKLKKENESHLQDYDLVIVDEASMVSLALLNEMTRSVDESRFDCLFEPSDVTSATPASVREDLDMAGVSVTFDSAKHLWIVSAYDPVAASVRDRLQAWPSLQARYLIYRRTRGEDDPEVRALLRGMDELGFDVAFSNGIPVEVSSRRAELLASLPKPPPDSGDFVACLLAVPPESWKPVDEAVVRGELRRLGAVPRFVGRSWLDLRKRAENGLDPPPHVRHLLFQLNTLQSRYERESRERELLPPNRLLGLSDECPRELLAFTRMAIYAEGYGVAFDHGNGLWILSDDPEEHPRELLQDVARYERLVGSTNRTDAVP